MSEHLTRLAAACNNMKRNPEPERCLKDREAARVLANENAKRRLLVDYLGKLQEQVTRQGQQGSSVARWLEA